tara:strand:+ start:2548 stop:3363 length:816 start_codon:yes stop_codon:yes gene_type:complete
VKDLTLYIPTCNKYLWLIKPFSFLFNRFWDESIKVVYLGYKTPDFELPPNFSFVSMGDDDNLSNWSVDLRGYFESIEDEYFMVTVDDSFLVDYTNTELYEKALRYLQTTDKNIGRFGLERDLVTRPHHYFDTFENTDFVNQESNAENRISIRWSIWKRDYIIRFLKDGRTPWTFESEGTIESRGDGVGIISTSLKNPPAPPDNAIIFNTNSIWRNWYDDFNRLNFNSCAHDSLKSLDSKVISEMLDLGLINRDVEIGSIYQREWYPIKLGD